LGIRPHFHVSPFPDFVAPKKQPDDCKTSYDSAANFPFGTQSSSEGIQSLDQVVIPFSEFFLCDHKNGLASMKVIHEEIHGLFLHLQSRHPSASSLPNQEDHVCLPVGRGSSRGAPFFFFLMRR
jgi:hypothetical protein